MTYTYTTCTPCPTFNIADLKPYMGEEDEFPSRTTSFQEGEDDEDINTIVTPTAPTLHIRDQLLELAHAN